MTLNVLLPTVLCVCTQVASDFAPTNITARDVVETWKDRESKVLTAEFSWKVKEAYTPEGVLELLRGPNEASSVAAPAKDIEFSYPSNLLLDGSRMRYSKSMMAVKAPPEYLQLEGRYISSYDGQSSRMLNLYAGGSRGIILNEQRNTDSISQHLVPLIWCFRGLNPTFTELREPELHVRGIIRMNQMDTLFVESPVRRFWLDPKREFIIVRLQGIRLSDGNPYYEADIDYQPDGMTAWVPQKWRVKAINRAQKITSTYEATVTKHAINLPVEKDAFRLDFPADANVYDGIRKKHIQPRDKTSKTDSN